jgi:hypothetical protein
MRLEKGALGGGSHGFELASHSGAKGTLGPANGRGPASAVLHEGAFPYSI